MQRLLLLGKETSRLGQVEQRELKSASLCLSVGSDPESPALAYKGHKDFPNEDAALALYDGHRWIFAVADGHLGHEVSHRLISALADSESIPARLGQLSLWLGQEGLLVDEAGGSTLLVVCFDEASGAGFGLSFGDCTMATFDSERITIRNRLNATYLRSGEPLPIELGQPFQFNLPRREMLLLFTDGVNECCYRDPQRSVQLAHLEKLRQNCDGSATRLARSVMDLALAGADGQPGGQDNIAVVAYLRP